MNKIIIMIILLGISSLLSATIWEIIQDGTGDFVTIQEGIDAATDGDTVLVHPGTYYENLSIENKSVTLASLYLTTGEEGYISQTIIDGNDIDTTIIMMYSNGSLISGFTVRGGKGVGNLPSGGGFRIRYSEVTVSDCVVEDNRARRGGGMEISHQSQVHLAGVTIRNNLSYTTGGGLSIFYPETAVTFDPDNLCNIYHNYAGAGNDISKSSLSEPMDVFVDTFTVAHYDQFFFICFNENGEPYPEDITFNALHGKIEPIAADLYVSAEGDNNNSGTSAADPLQSIHYALALIEPDSLTTRYIHVADGFYSPHNTSEKLPLNLRPNVYLIGESMQNTIIDGDELAPFIHGRKQKADYLIENFTFQNYKAFHHGIIYPIGFSLNNSKSHALDDEREEGLIRLNNIYITNNKSYAWLVTGFMSNIFMNNVIIEDNETNLVLYIVIPYTDIVNNEVVLKNMIMNNITTFQPENGLQAKGIQLMAGTSGMLTDKYLRIMNSQFTNIHNILPNPNPSPEPYISLVIGLEGDVNVDIINCTIADNQDDQCDTATAISARSQIELNIVNSILYNNTRYEIVLGRPSGTIYSAATANVSHSLIQGGEDNVVVHPNSTLNWGEGNIDTYPYFVGEGDYPYMLMNHSAAIDAGTLDLPEGVELPEYDLAGNPRIFGDNIDMGAYEWQGTFAEPFVIPVNTPKLQVYPNPFNPESTIALSIHSAAEVEIALYNAKGQKVRNILSQPMQAGEHRISFDGKDERGRILASGVYLLSLTIDDEKVEQRKITVVK